ncbi:MAG TPA: hypothetical protein VF581_08210 [Flavobacterium sp.]|jgi:hypothetical protein
MQAIKDDASLAEAIKQLESRKVMQTDDLRILWEKSKEELNPGTMLKEGIHDTVHSSDFQSNLIKGGISLVTGIISKKLFVGDSHDGLKKMVGTMIQGGATGLMYQNTDAMKSKGASILSGILKKMRIG